MARNLARVAGALIALLVLAGQLARAAPSTRAVQNDTLPAWSSNGIDVAFERVLPGGGTRVFDESAGGSSVHAVAEGSFRGWVGGTEHVLVQVGNRTEVYTDKGRDLATLDGGAATSSPDGSLIAYLRGGRLYVSDPSGANERLLATGAEPPADDVTGPAWSPDGTRIAYSGGTTLFTARLDGSGPTRLFVAAGPTLDPAWSPDGRTIAFEQQRNGHRSIWEVGADGSDPHAVVSGSYDARFPQFSPADGSLAFSDDELHVPVSGPPYRYALYVLPPDGTTPRRLALDVSPTSPPRWSPTGAYIAFAAAQGCRRFGVYTVQAGHPQRARRRSNLCRF
ncbi:MAG: TolB family protein [Gaiellaceae bacterium]